MTNRYFINSKELIDLVYNPFKFKKIMKDYKIKDFHKARAYDFEDLCEFVLSIMPKHKRDFQNKRCLIDQSAALCLIRHLLRVMDPTFVLTTDIIKQAEREN